MKAKKKKKKKKKKQKKKKNRCSFLATNTIPQRLSHVGV